MYDTPVYKVLSANDTGNSRGHQGGMVIPSDIEEFFPDVEGDISPEAPTADVPIVADLIVDGHLVATVVTRYQFQTWGGTRSPERRLTSGLGPLRNVASSGDMVLFSRDPERTERMILTLIRQGSPEYNQIISHNPGRRWGVIPGLPAPTTNREIRVAEREIDDLGDEPFSAFDNTRPIVEAPVRRKSRNAAFRKLLLRTYGARCMASGESVLAADGSTNIDAAHIIPVEAGGSDDLRNGLLLSKDLHWAFDKGLFSLTEDYSIVISNHIRVSGHGEPVKRLSGKRLEFGSVGLRPHLDAVAWHRNHRFVA